MRPDDLYLKDLRAALEAIARFLEGVDERRFLDDELLQSAVLQKLTVIGEAAARLSDETRAESPDIEWRTIVGLRNAVVHEYFAISCTTIWETARRDLPELSERVRELLERRNREV